MPASLSTMLILFAILLAILGYGVPALVVGICSLIWEFIVSGAGDGIG